MPLLNLIALEIPIFFLFPTIIRKIRGGGKEGEGIKGEYGWSGEGMGSQHRPDEDRQRRGGRRIGGEGDPTARRGGTTGCRRGRGRNLVARFRFIWRSGSRADARRRRSHHVLICGTGVGWLHQHESFAVPVSFFFF